MPALKNPKHERFAQECAKGTDEAAAYRKVYPKAAKDSARSAGPRLFAIVRPRVSELQAKVEGVNLLTMKERRDFLARVVRVRLKGIDLDKDGDLLEEFSEEAGKIRFRLPSKRACIMDDAKLAGELIDKTDLTTDGEALPSVMPQIIVSAPSVNRRRAHLRN